MRALKNNERGLSLVEVTIMLLVLMLLTGVLVPSMFDFINDARWVKVKEDCEAIGLSVARLTRDVGPCLKFAGNAACTKDNRVDLLHSDGPAIDSQSTDTEVVNANLAGGNLNWDHVSRSDSMENQFVTNASRYPTPTSSMTVGPLFGLGWRGAYLSPPIGRDPWGHMYLVNSAFLAVAGESGAFSVSSDHSVAGSGNSHGGGNTGGGWSYNTFCISAGPNGVYETSIGGNANGGVTRTGDDFIFVIGGGTR